jgi:Putative esterase
LTSVDVRTIRTVVQVICIALFAGMTPGAMAETAASPLRFEVSFPTSVHSQPITGRLFLMISHRGEPEVRLQSTWFNSPEIVALDVHNLVPGQAVVVDARPLGTPLRSIEELAPGDYYVQAVLNVYTEFHRADGHTIWAHMDQGEGQQFNRSPGNLYSKVQKLHLQPSGTFRVSLSEVIAPLPIEPDTGWVKQIRIQSELLSSFWGRPMYLSAVVLLPRGYLSHPETHYPVIYYQPEHFRSFPPFEFTTADVPESESARRSRESAGYERGFEFSQAWRSEHFPRLVAVSMQTPTPLSDWSGAVDSANNGPYGQAIMTELIPAIEKQFRIIREPYARVLTGKHSGGRAALALQLLHPDFFGGAWVFHPWPFNFQRWSTLNIYEDDDVFLLRGAALPEGLGTIAEWLPMERYVARTAADVPLVTARQLSQHDAVMAGMAGGDPIGADDAINGPVGENGLPRPLWNRATGKLDHEVALYWRDHGDLAYYAKENWPKIGAQLVGKLHFYIGDLDMFYRNYGVRLFEGFLKTTQNPHYEGSFTYAPASSGWQPMTNAQLVKIMAEHVAANSPGATDVR